MRRKQKFFLIWIVILGLAFAGRGSRMLADNGYSDLNGLASDLLRITLVGSLFLIPLAFWFGRRREKNRKETVGGKTAR